ncbi:MAG: twin-arginine translocation signal domain-containing protein [Candidatus Eremiobacterota bacterium]
MDKLFSKTTIVGGQPDNTKSIIPGINNTVEKLLMKAASDENFREKFLNDRAAVLEHESSLNHIDRNMLISIPSSTLNSMIEKFISQMTSRRDFIKGAASSAAFIAGAFVFPPSFASAITPAPPGGARPDPPVFTEQTGIDGGTVNYSYTGLKLIIPPGALSETVNISIRVILPPSKAPENVCFFGEVYEFFPADLRFSEEITVNFPCHGYDVTGVYFWNKREWKSVPVESLTETDGYTVAKIKHFGIYTLGCQAVTPFPTKIPVTRGIDPH